MSKRIKYTDEPIEAAVVSDFLPPPDQLVTGVEDHNVPDNSMTLRTFGAWLLVIVIPAIIWSAYVYASRMTRTFSSATDFSVLALVVAVGVAGMLILNRAPGIRVFATLSYAVIAGALMYAGMLASTCYLGDCPW